VAAACAVVLAFGLTGLVAAGAVTARHRAQAAADLGALAGAPWTVVLPDHACAAAAAVVAANGADLVTCRIEGVDVVVTAAVPVSGAPPGTGPATATARAGPQRDGQP
jgi:secretion/DNA translocation related TadE-like protein